MNLKVLLPSHRFQMSVWQRPHVFILMAAVCFSCDTVPPGSSRNDFSRLSINTAVSRLDHFRWTSPLNMDFLHCGGRRQTRRHQRTKLFNSNQLLHMDVWQNTASQFCFHFPQQSESKVTASQQQHQQQHQVFLPCETSVTEAHGGGQTSLAQLITASEQWGLVEEKLFHHGHAASMTPCSAVILHTKGGERLLLSELRQSETRGWNSQRGWNTSQTCCLPAGSQRQVTVYHRVRSLTNYYITGGGWLL